MIWTVTLLSFVLAQSQSLAECGPGSLFRHDNGYWTAPKEHGGKWVLLPKTMRVLGKAPEAWAGKRLLLVCVENGCDPGDGISLIRPETIRSEDWVRRRPGKLSVWYRQLSNNYGEIDGPGISEARGSFNPKALPRR